MARKNPSTHSDAQFALFVDKMKNMPDDARSSFEHVLRRLIGAATRGPLDELEAQAADLDRRAKEGG